MRRQSASRVVITHWGYRPGGNPFRMTLALLEALVTRPYQFLTTEQMTWYETLNVGAALTATLLVPLI